MPIKISGNKILECKRKIRFLSLGKYKCKNCGNEWNAYSDEEMRCTECKSENVTLTLE